VLLVLVVLAQYAARTLGVKDAQVRAC